MSVAFAFKQLYWLTSEINEAEQDRIKYKTSLIPLEFRPRIV